MRSNIPRMRTPRTRRDTLTTRIKRTAEALQNSPGDHTPPRLCRASGARSQSKYGPCTCERTAGRPAIGERSDRTLLLVSSSWTPSTHGELPINIHHAQRASSDLPYCPAQLPHDGRPITDMVRPRAGHLRSKAFLARETSKALTRSSGSSKAHPSAACPHRP